MFYPFTYMYKSYGADCSKMPDFTNQNSIKKVNLSKKIFYNQFCNISITHKLGCTLSIKPFLFFALHIYKGPYDKTTSFLLVFSAHSATSKMYFLKKFFLTLIYSNVSLYKLINHIVPQKCLVLFRNWYNMQISL